MVRFQSIGDTCAVSIVVFVLTCAVMGYLRWSGSLLFVDETREKEKAGLRIAEDGENSEQGASRSLLVLIVEGLNYSALTQLPGQLILKVKSECRVQPTILLSSDLGRRFVRVS
ncbi:MAG TPA: hypothetical protein VKZ53_14810 [Candidatus Angelobacter sp.]|nr:hypothetical protein [Candidatus Angelobacter sp.]